MRVAARELQRIAAEVIQRGSSYAGDNLDGAIIDCDFALSDAGFTSPLTRTADDRTCMVSYVCRPDWQDVDSTDVVSRLEEAWVGQAAFTEEAHSISSDEDQVVLDFVTWWPRGDYCTGRIDVLLGRDP